MPGVSLRTVQEADAEIFFQQQKDPEANQMAAFTSKDPSDREVYMARWRRITQNPGCVIRAILLEGEVAGSILHYQSEYGTEISYWIGREYWGKGVASEALQLFIKEQSGRPMFARVAKDNVSSHRVLEKCGFVVIAQERGFAEARKAEIDELVLRLD